MALTPKVSCLLPTKDRFEMVVRSISCYCRQTYPNKELVIASEGLPEYQERLRGLVVSLGRDDIRLVFVEGGHWNLGKMRNLTLDKARGELVCQWDDDDLFHPRRLERQVETVLAQDAQSCFMTEQIQYFPDRGEMYYVDWSGQPPPRAQVIPGTMMCRRGLPARYPEEGPHCTSYEDMVFFRQLLTLGTMARLTDEGHLYIYTFHGGNVYPFEHHWSLVQRKAVNVESLLRRRRQLEAGLDQYGEFDTPIHFLGNNGPAFTYNPGRPPGGKSLGPWMSCGDDRRV